jgi:hypothetical protein
MTENQQLAHELEVFHQLGAWYVRGLGDGIDMGPYRTQQEAHEAKLGVQRFLRHGTERGFVSVAK